MRKSPDASGALATAMGPRAAATPTGRMLVGDAVPWGEPREAVGRSLIGGDFNSKSPEWGEARLNRRGIIVGEMVARNDLSVLNQGRQFAFRRGAGGSIIDLTIAAPRRASRISNWSNLEVITLSDHRCIEFDLEQQS